METKKYKCMLCESEAIGTEITCEECGIFLERFGIWVKQGKYTSEKGVPMILVLSEETGATVLEPLVISKK